MYPRLAYSAALLYRYLLRMLAYFLARNSAASAPHRPNGMSPVNAVPSGVLYHAFASALRPTCRYSTAVVGLQQM